MMPRLYRAPSTGAASPSVPDRSADRPAQPSPAVANREGGFQAGLVERVGGIAPEDEPDECWDRQGADEPV